MVTMKADVAGPEAPCQHRAQLEGWTQFHVDTGGEVLLRQQGERRTIDTLLTERLGERKRVMVI